MPCLLHTSREAIMANGKSVKELTQNRKTFGDYLYLQGMGGSITFGDIFLDVKQSQGS